MTKKHRDGDKLRGSHTTLTEVAVQVFDIVSKIPNVDGISAGIIQAGAGGPRRVKIKDESGCILLIVRSGRAIQQLRVYVKELQNTRLALSRALRNNDIPISFK